MSADPRMTGLPRAVVELVHAGARALRDGGPALLMERPVGSQHAYLGNLYGHRERIEAAEVW